MTHIEAMEQAQPVAIVTGYYGGRLTITPYNLSAILPTGLALYTAPPSRQPLTDEEILSEAKRFALGLAFPFNGITTPEMFARAIEANLKEKNT
jgi:hypothetical protein